MNKRGRNYDYGLQNHIEAGVLFFLAIVDVCPTAY
jgi:hypothetical protein